MKLVRTYASFEPGQVIGEHSESVTQEQVATWRQIYPGGTDAEARASLIVICMMRAYMAITEPRPNGNIHARQKLDIAALPADNETIRTQLRVLSKAMRKDRRYVELEVEGWGDTNRPLFCGVMTAIWAA